jgi:hypothetical protein
MPSSTVKVRKTAKKAVKAGSSQVRWSARVMKESDAMDLKKGIFKQSSALAIARSLKSSAERSTRRKSPPFRSAMSMLNFEINRGGTNISDSRRRILNQAKVQLRRLFDRPK